MTRAGMVIAVFKEREALIMQGPDNELQENPSETAELTTIHQGDIRIDLTRRRVYIIHKLSRQVLYSGLIPPSATKFKDLLTWIGL